MRKFLIRVNGKAYEVDVEERGAASAAPAPMIPAAPPAPVAVPAAPVAAPAAPAAAPVAASTATQPGAGESVFAPMPGTILRVDVKNGDAVKKGQVLMILEAMKMENEIMAPREGAVTSVLAQRGATVNSGDPLVTIE